LVSSAQIYAVRKLLCRTSTNSSTNTADSSTRSYAPACIRPWQPHRPGRRDERAGGAADTNEPATNSAGTGRLRSSHWEANGKPVQERRSFDVCGAKTQLF
jgi:hypothetical protein